MATKTGIINHEDKHNELSRASLLIGEKERQIRRFSKKEEKVPYSYSWRSNRNNRSR